MSQRILVPDTGILLAVGFGSETDPKATTANQALSRTVAAGTRIVVPPSVSDELDNKLAELDVVFGLLQDATHALPSGDDAPVGLDAAEKVLLALRNKEGVPYSRFIDLIEGEVSRAIALSPSAPLTSVFGYVAANALLWKEGAKLGSHPSSVEFLQDPKPDYTPLEPPIPQVHGPDLAHIRACQQIGEREGAVVIFLILERVLYSRKSEIESKFPSVRVTKPAFLEAYLGST